MKYSNVRYHGAPPACCTPVKRVLALTVLIGLVALCPAQPEPRRQATKAIQLSKPRLQGKLSLEEILAQQRPIPVFLPKPLGLDEIGQLAWAGQGVIEPQTGLRTVPSLEAIYPIYLYFATPEGLFTYNPQSHTLEQNLAEDIRGRLALSVGQPVITQAPCTVLVTGSVRKLAIRYGRQGRKYMLLEAGQVVENIRLEAASLGLGLIPLLVFDAREVRRLCRLPMDREPLYLICVGYTAETEQSLWPAGARQKKAVLIVPQSLFRDEELFETRRALDQAGIQTTVASTQVGLVMGILGGRAESQLTIEQLKLDDFDAVIFIGGPGAREYFDNPAILGIARQARQKQKIIGAISIAPTILANAGLLEGVHVTGFLTERDKLVQAGAVYTGSPVERDGLIITARDPRSASQFGRAIADAVLAPKQQAQLGPAHQQSGL